MRPALISSSLSSMSLVGMERTKRISLSGGLLIALPRTWSRGAVRARGAKLQFGDRANEERRAAERRPAWPRWRTSGRRRRPGRGLRPEPAVDGFLGHLGILFRFEVLRPAMIVLE